MISPAESAILDRCVAAGWASRWMVKDDVLLNVVWTDKGLECLTALLMCHAALDLNQPGIMAVLKKTAPQRIVTAIFDPPSADSASPR